MNGSSILPVILSAAKNPFLCVGDFRVCIIIGVHHHKKGKGKCPIYLKHCSTYDTDRKARLLSYVPIL